MSQIISIVLLIVFALIFFLALLAALAGFIKGLYKTMVKTILVAVLLGIFIFLTPSITNAVGNIDLSGLKAQVQVNGTMVAVTSIQETLANIITATGLISPMNGISIYQTAIALANSLLSYVIFFVLVLFTQLFIWLFTAIVYNGIFRWFLPVESASERRERKMLSKERQYLTKGMYFEDEEPEEGKKEPEIVDPYQQEELLRGQEPGEDFAEPFEEANEEDDEEGYSRQEDAPVDDYGFEEADTRHRLPLLRLPSAVLGACCEFVLALVLVSPFTALTRTALDHQETLNTILSNVEFGDNKFNAQEINNALDEAKGSMLFGLLGAGNFDTTIMNYASRVTVGGQSISFNELLSSVLDIASPLIDGGAVTFENGIASITINFSKLLNDSMVNSLVGIILQNPVVLALIPPAIDIGINTISSASLPLDQLDFANIDWSNQLEALAKIYSQIYGTGVINSIFSEDGMAIKPENFVIHTSRYDAETNPDGMTDEEFNKNLALYSEALKGVGNLDVLKQNLPQIFASLGTYLSSKGVDILPTDANDYADVDWGMNLSLIGSSALRLARLFDLDISLNTDFQSALANLSQNSFETTEEAQEFVSELEDIICGTEQVPGLLNSSILTKINFGDVLSSTLSMIPALQSYLPNVDFSALNGLSSQELVEQFRPLFSILEQLLDPDFSIDFQKGISGIDFSSPEVAEDLANILQTASESPLFTDMYPSIIQNFLSNKDLQIPEYLFGLTPYNFNFEDPGFTEDFEKLVRQMPGLYNIYEIMNSEGTAEEQFQKIDTEAIKNLLELLVESEFFNPDLETGIPNSNGGRNYNIYVLLKNLFDSPMLSGLGLSAPSLETVSTVSWTSSEGQGEIDKIVAMLNDAKKNASFLFGGAQGEIQDPDALGDMIRNGMDSEVLRPSILSIVNSSMNEFLDKMGIHKTINEIRTEMWKDEDTDAIVDILTLAGDLDFNDPDLLSNIDADKLNALLTSLYRTTFLANCFGSPLTGDETEEQLVERRNRNFSEIISALLKNQDFFSQLGIENFNFGSFFDVSWRDMNDNSTLVIGQGEDAKTYPVTKAGEIAGLCDFVRSIQSVGIENLQNGKLPAGFLTNSLTDESKTSRVVMSLLASVLTNVVSDMEFGSGFEGMQNAISGIDFYQLVGMSVEEINHEFAFIQEIYDLSQKQEGESESRLEKMLGNLFDMSEESMVDFHNLTTLMGQSKLMTTVPDGKTRSPLGNLLYAIFQKTDSQSTGSSSLLAQITLADEEKDFEHAFDGLLSQVTDWQAEMEDLYSFVVYFSDFDIQTPGMLNEIFMDASNENQIPQMLLTMNESAIFHRLPISIFRQNIGTANNSSDLASLFRNPSTNEEREIDFFVHLTNSKEDVAYWNNEIEHAVHMFFQVSTYLYSADGFTDVSIATEGEDGLSIDILYDIGCMDLLKDVRSNMVYNLIINTASSSASTYIDKVFQDVLIYGEDKNSARIEQLLFQNPILLEEDADGKLVLNPEKTHLDLNALTEVLMSVLDNISDFAASDNLDAIFPNGKLAVSFEELTQACFYDYSGIVYRSRLASELVAGLLQQLLDNKTIIDMVQFVDKDFEGFGFTTADIYGQTLTEYPMVNPVEGSAIESFLNSLYSLTNVQDGSLGLTPEEANALLATLGIQGKDFINDEVKESYEGLANARFGSKESIYSVVRMLPVQTTNGLVTIGSKLGTDFNPETEPYPIDVFGVDSSLPSEE